MKKNKKTSVESTFDDNAEISDTSTDDFEIISIDEGVDFGFASDKKSNESFETVSKSGQKSHTAENIVKTDTINAAATKNGSGISNETNNKMAADHSRPSKLAHFIHY